MALHTPDLRVLGMLIRISAITIHTQPLLPKKEMNLNISSNTG
jgi:hypothetical protein